MRAACPISRNTASTATCETPGVRPIRSIASTIASPISLSAESTRIAATPGRSSRTTRSTARPTARATSAALLVSQSASAKARDRTVNVAAIIRAALESRVRRAGPHVVG
ncbi:Uncharacterised protein [Mycobacteroides abscessus subsp. abscessus]|nr:Uncharacterised protein [Mycobacteroides abscessus subsp. abscessus]